MTQPISGIPDPGTPRPFKRRYQPGVLQGAFKGALRMVGPYSEEVLRSARLYGRELWRKGKRNPRALGLAGGAVALTLLGAYALSATGAGAANCPAASDGKPPFLLLIDPIPPASPGSKIDIHYDVCGLKAGTSYKGRIQLSPLKTGGKKATRSTPRMIKFQEKVDGPATRHQRQIVLGPAKPGSYTVDLTVVDGQGRARRKQQRMLIQQD
jgi:hypothetical protein